MKKFPAILLLMLGGAVIITLIALVTAVLFIILASMIPAEGGWVLYTAAAMFLFLSSYPFRFLREFYKREHNVNAAVFTVCFCAPSLIAAGAVNIFCTPGEIGVFSGEAVIRFWLIITAVFTFWMIVHACIEAYMKHRDNNA